MDRVFITGVSPVVLSDITSGYYIAENIYLLPEFNDLCGFLEDETIEIVQEIAQQCQFYESKITEAMTMLKSFYNGYCFYDRRVNNLNSDSLKLVYNPTLILYFVKQFQKNCQYPQEMLDSNLAADQDKLAYVSQLPGGKDVIFNALNEQYLPTIDRLFQSFGLKEILNAAEDETVSASLL